MNVSIPVYHRRRQACTPACPSNGFRGFKRRDLGHRGAPSQGLHQPGDSLHPTCEPKAISASSVLVTTYSSGARAGLDAGRVPWRPGAPEEAWTNRPTRSRTAQHGHPGAKRWRPLRELAGFEKARPRFVGPDFRGSRRGWQYCAVCLVRAVYAGCHSRLSVVTS
jgi:hypothetical protein